MAGGGQPNHLSTACTAKGRNTSPDQPALRAAVEQLLDEKAIENGIPSSKQFGYKLRGLQDLYFGGLALRWVKHTAEGRMLELVAKQRV